MAHHTKDKGDLACVLAIADLSRKGYAVFTPVVCEHLPFDLIAYKDGRSHRIQCKYAADGVAKHATSWADKSGSHVRKYGPQDFDYFALYLPQIDRVIYPSIAFRGCVINCTIPGCFQPFYWYEDFLDLTDTATKRTFRDFDGTGGNTGGLRGGPRKAVRPDAQTLEAMLWASPTVEVAARFGVSDSAVGKWAREYGIAKPPRGYWSKQQKQSGTDA